MNGQIWCLSQSQAGLLRRRRQSAPLHGYRAWRIMETVDGYRLASVCVSALWAGPVVRTGMFGKDVITTDWPEWPDIGIHAYSHPGRWIYYLPAFGEVDLFGRVVVCERGYRAERARIVSLCIKPTYPFEMNDKSICSTIAMAYRIAREFERVYDCPVTVRHWTWTWVKRWRSWRSSWTKWMRRARRKLLPNPNPSAS